MSKPTNSSHSMHIIKVKGKVKIEVYIGWRCEIVPHKLTMLDSSNENVSSFSPYFHKTQIIYIKYLCLKLKGKFVEFCLVSLLDGNKVIKQIRNKQRGKKGKRK